MKTYFAYLSLLALGTVVEGYDYSLNAFTQTSCQAFTANIHITQGGDNKGNSPGGTRSFLVVHPDNGCKTLIYKGPNQSGDFAGFFENEGEGVCFGFGDGSEIRSFNVVCN